MVDLYNQYNFSMIKCVVIYSKESNNKYFKSIKNGYYHALKCPDFYKYLMSYYFIFINAFMTQCFTIVITKIIDALYFFKENSNT